MGCSNSKDTGVEKATTAIAAGDQSGESSTFIAARNFRDPSIALRKVAETASKTATGVKDAAHHVRNVFATPLDKTEFANYTPPVHAKTADETKFITAALTKNFVFENLTESELDPLVKAFVTCHVEADSVIIEQGKDGDYFYIIKEGKCAFIVDDKKVGAAATGNSFGELALMYTCPRAATVKATTAVQLYRVDQKTFRFILQNQTAQGEANKGALLKGVDFLKDLDAAELSKLAQVMTPKPFNNGDFLIRKGEAADYFYIIQEGSLMATDIGVGDTTYEDVALKAGDYVGERALVTGDPRAANVVAKTDGMAFGIDRATFEQVLGTLSVLILRSQDKRKLVRRCMLLCRKFCVFVSLTHSFLFLQSGIKAIKDTRLDERTMRSLASLIKDRTFKAGETICQEGVNVEAALYLVRDGKITVTNKAGSRSETVVRGGYFGDDQLLADRLGEKEQIADSTLYGAVYTATVTEDCTCGILTLAEFRKIIDTHTMGEGGKERQIQHDSFRGQKITMRKLKRHTLLGAGTFGQVWLVSRKASDGTERAYALKVQSKYELAQDGQAKAVVDEKNIMSQLIHPFISNLVGHFQDKDFVYMLMGLVQGGELYSQIHTDHRDGVKEVDAGFYAAGIAEALAHMHRRGFVYRDLKPENVMLDSDGYPVIVDFGFAKYLTDKTYTLCGTPLYLPPEVILSRGHKWSADHWSLGVLIFEMITGDTPFYQSGMEQMDLFRSIAKAKFEMPSTIQKDAADMIRGFLTKDPNKRLGSLAGGEDDIYTHPWFNIIDFVNLRKKSIKAPYKPNIKNPLDASNFENW